MNRLTSYEVGLYGRDGALTDVLGFSQRHTRGALLTFAQRHGAKVSALMTESELDEEWRYDRETGAVIFGGGIRVAYTQRTAYQVASAAPPECPTCGGVNDHRYPCTWGES